MALLKLLLKWLFQLRLVNFERLVFESRTIIMANHVSFLDAVFLALFLPEKAVFVVNTEIVRKLSFFIKRRRHITIDPLNPYSIRDLVNAVKAGDVLVIFPEGRITVTNSLMKIYNGIGHIALKTGAVIYPIHIEGLEFSKFSRLTDKLPSCWFPSVSLHVGKPFKIDIQKDNCMKDQTHQAAELIAQKMQENAFRARYIPGKNLFNDLVLAAEKYGMGREVLEDLSQKLTYRKLLIGVYALSEALRKSLAGQKAVGVLLPNANGHVVALFSLFRLNIAPAILNFTLGPKNLEDCCETAGLSAVLTSRFFVEKAGIQPQVEQLQKHLNVIFLEDVRGEISAVEKVAAIFRALAKERASVKDDTLILFTSGSESKPKGVVLTHENLASNIIQASCVIDFTPKDKILNVLPMFHSFGLTAGTLLPLLKGVSLFLYPSPLHYKVIPEVAYDRNATILFGTSTFLHGYGKHGHPMDFYSLRYAFAGAEKLKEETRKLWYEKFGIRILEGYGCTETSPILSLNTPMYTKMGTVGRLLPHIEHKLEPVEGIQRGGKLLVRGPNMMKGYMIHGKSFVPVGDWYDTGDLVEIDDEGYVTILSRVKRFAKVAGEMVSLNLVEELVSQVLHTPELAVISVPDSRKGEKLVLFATLKNIDRNKVREAITSQGHSPLLIPAQIIYLDTLPLLGSGKTDYVSLQEMYNSLTLTKSVEQEDGEEEDEQ